MKYDSGKLSSRKCRENRALLGSRFKVLLADAGLTPEAAAQMLHVTPRTVRYWISGKVTVPYTAYRLVRVMRLFELPCEGWEGWHMHSGKLWSPEGHGFLPSDSGWWGGLVRRARLFHDLYQRDVQLDIALQRMRTGDGAGGTALPSAALARRLGGQAAPSPTAKRSGGEADRPNLLLEHLKKKRSAKDVPHWGNTFGVTSSYKLVSTNKGGK